MGWGIVGWLRPAGCFNPGGDLAGAIAEAFQDFVWITEFKLGPLLKNEGGIGGWCDGCSPVHQTHNCSQLEVTPNL